MHLQRRRRCWVGPRRAGGRSVGELPRTILSRHSRATHSFKTMPRGLLLGLCNAASRRDRRPCSTSPGATPGRQPCAPHAMPHSSLPPGPHRIRRAPKSARSGTLARFWQRALHGREYVSLVPRRGTLRRSQEKGTRGGSGGLVPATRPDAGAAPGARHALNACAVRHTHVCCRFATDACHYHSIALESPGGAGSVAHGVVDSRIVEDASTL
jgi:hypothetical protein